MIVHISGPLVDKCQYFVLLGTDHSDGSWTAGFFNTAKELALLVARPHS